MTHVASNESVEKRQLRAEIARCRRRIDGGIRKSSRASRRLASWRTYAERWPAAALVGGLGLGWLLAAGLRPRVVVGVLGGRATRQLTNRLIDLLIAELKRFWKETTPAGQSGREGGDHG